jgi:hypothetical protein
VAADREVTSGSGLGRALAELEEIFARWLDMKDAGPLRALLGAVAANRMLGDPVWPLLVGPPGCGKTELLQSLRKLPEAHFAATMTEAALLSGTPQADRAESARGGLLREIGDHGLIICKDFGSVLSMQRDERGRVLAALREIYDGRWTRRVGAEGGRALSWEGRAGFVGGCPPTLDRHHEVIASLGERFVLLRMGDGSPAQAARMALRHAGREAAMRDELADAVASLFTARPTPAGEPVPLGEPVRSWLIDLATLACRCRSPVIRGSYGREIELVPGAESPTRLVVTLKRLHDGLLAIGIAEMETLRLLARIALDSVPALRLKVLRAVLDLGKPDTTAVAARVSYPSNTARRQLEDLGAYNLVLRCPAGKGKADSWTAGEIDDSARRLLRSPKEGGPDIPDTVSAPPSTGGVPEMSDHPLALALEDRQSAPGGQW